MARWRTSWEYYIDVDIDLTTGPLPVELQGIPTEWWTAAADAVRRFGKSGIWHIVHPLTPSQ